ncbi:MAG: hypothetical protein M3268_09340 [Acidobacteriota bacterium]|nr:hypothetical protein [Acidobacteriota bacterium]
MPNRALNRTLLFASVLLSLAGAAGAGARQPQTRPAAPAASESVSDAQIAKELAGTNKDKASRATREVVRRGGRMIPLLMELKGNRQCFYGDMALGSHAGCSARFMPKKRDGCYEASYSSTIEVAALFLIEAVYRNDLEFAQGATLADWEASGEVRTDIKYNEHELIARAWAAAEVWRKELDREGLDALRAKESGPFAGTRIGFY